MRPLLIPQLGCCKRNPVSRVGLTPSPTCHTGQGGFPKGDAATSATKRVARECQPSSGNQRRVFHLEWRTYALGGFSSNLPVRANAELAKSETRPFVPFSGSATSRHTRSSAELITTTSGFKFSVHTSLGFWDRGSQNRGKERQLVDARGQPGDELFQAVVQ
jgi:hypothetical protein